MTPEQRKDLIPQLDHYLALAQRLQREMTMVLSAQGDVRIEYAQRRAYDLVNALEDASSAFKRANAALIEAHVTRWHRFRLDDGDNEDIPEEPDPVYESVIYDGGDVWSVTITTPTHGRERVVVHSDAASWHSVYSADPA